MITISWSRETGEGRNMTFIIIKQNNKAKSGDLILYNSCAVNLVKAEA